MPGSKLMFPKDLQDNVHGHWVNIQAIGRTNQGNGDQIMTTVTLFVPGGGGQSAQMIWETKHDFVDAKMARILPGMLGFGGGAGIIPGMAGASINPKVEVLYRNTNLRSFQFDFFLAPSSAEEAIQMKEIFKTLRAYSSPTLAQGSSDPRAGYVGSAADQFDYLSSGGLYLSPHEWLIDFYYRDDRGGVKPNYNMPRIGRSVLEQVIVNYAPTGQFSAFHDGNPVAAQLTLQFREMRIIDEANINTDPLTDPVGGY